ncbi:MAG TPA: hypothetical protein VMQ40_00785 [Acidimicrobiales bacterium]|jgi:hypothetical protein|nr:hypothetical protein [Acidimicrobiales bacterium]
MRVPFDGGEHGRLVRAHELMHARVSPLIAGAFDLWPLPARAVECAEEFRVNHVLGRLGFDLTELRDGSERLTGTRLADAGEWDETIWFAAAVSGTRALRDVVGGVRRVRPAWADACRALERALVAKARLASTASLASTRPGHQELPLGYAEYTRAFAELITAHVDRGPGGSGLPRAARPGERPAATGTFAPLVLDRSVTLDRRVTGAVAPRRAPSAIGRRVVRPERLVTDPSRRLFHRTSKGSGGVVVVDQSGSMALSNDDLERLLAAAPGAFVLGYSHAPGSSGVPNAWVLAQRGRAASTVRAGNVGNGVDGPALRFALSHRRGGEGVIWICDGQVTDSGDHADLSLAEECARLVVRHGIRMVSSVEGALGLLGSRRAPVGGTLALGRVGACVAPCP